MKIITERVNSLTTGHVDATKQTVTLETSLSTAIAQTDALKQQVVTLRHDNDKLNSSYRIIEKERHDFETKLGWTNENLVAAEKRERQAMDEAKKIEHKYRELADQKVLCVLIIRLQQ